MKISNLLDIIEHHLPPQTAMDGDRIGLQVKTADDEVHNLLITMELDDRVIEEAVSLNSDGIITFHPLIFSPITQINTQERVGRLLTSLIKNGITLISVHTNFDNYIKGTSRLLSERLNLVFDGFLQPDNNLESYGMGVLCHSKHKIKMKDLLARVSEICSSPLRYCIGKSDDINKIAIVGGSGSSFIDKAVESGADAFITADISYHNFHRAVGKMALIDPGHYEMEQFVADGLYNLLKEKIESEVILNVSKSYTNPVRYYPDDNYTENQKKYIINKF